LARSALRSLPSVLQHTEHRSPADPKLHRNLLRLHALASQLYDLSSPALRRGRFPLYFPSAFALATPSRCRSLAHGAPNWLSYPFVVRPIFGTGHSMACHLTCKGEGRHHVLPQSYSLCRGTRTHRRHASWRTTIAARTIAARQRPEEPPGLDAGLYRIWIEEALRRWLAARRAYRPSEILRASDSIALSNHSLTKQPHQRYQDDYDRQYEPFLFHGYSSPWLTNRQRRRSPLGGRSSAGLRGPAQQGSL
jgi:hypothetical protein